MIVEKNQSVKEEVAKNNQKTKRLNEFLSNPNIFCLVDKCDTLRVGIESYDYNTLENKRKTQSLFKKLKEFKGDILKLYNVEYFICSVDGYNIDGLSESNSNLLNSESVLYCNY